MVGGGGWWWLVVGGGGWWWVVGGDDCVNSEIVNSNNVNNEFVNKEQFKILYITNFRIILTLLVPGGGDSGRMVSLS